VDIGPGALLIGRLIDLAAQRLQPVDAARQQGKYISFTRQAASQAGADPVGCANDDPTPARG
jgi:hypothetical protein